MRVCARVCVCVCGGGGGARAHVGVCMCVPILMGVPTLFACSMLTVVTGNRHSGCHGASAHDTIKLGLHAGC